MLSPASSGTRKGRDTFPYIHTVSYSQHAVEHDAVRGAPPEQAVVLVLPKHDFVWYTSPELAVVCPYHLNR